jgi:hypothetical protein
VIKFISALLFAIVLVCFGAGGTWWWAMQEAENSLNALLNEVFQGHVEYHNVVWQKDPQQVHMQLNQITINWQDTAGREYAYAIDYADVRTDFLQAQRVVVDLPTQQNLTVTHPTGKVETFTIQTRNGKLLFSLPEKQGQTQETTLTFDDATISSSRQQKAWVSLGAGLVEYRPGFATPHITLGIEDIQVQDPVAEQEIKLESLTLDVELLNLPALEDLLLPLLTTHWYPVAQELSLQTLRSAAKYGGQLRIRDWNQIWDDKQIGIHGAITFDREQRLSGDLSLTANRKDVLVNILQELNGDLLRIYGKTLTNLFKWKQENQVTGSLSFAHGQILYDGKRVGEAPVLTKVLELD